MKVRRTGMRRLRPGVVALAASLAMIGTSLPGTGGAPAAAGTTATAAANGGLDPSVFQNPGGDSRPGMLWFWNGRITTDLIDSQLRELREHGIEQAVLFPFDTANLQPAFLTDGWFDMVGHALREARDLGMTLWLFNDDHFPSGRAAGLIANGGTVGTSTYPAHPELRAQGLTRHETTVTGPTSVSLVPSKTGLAVEDGSLVVDAATLNGVSVLRTGHDWSDYTVTSDILGSGAAGTMVRAQDPGDGYLVDLRADGGMEIYREMSGGFTLLATTQPAAGFDSSVTHHLSVTVTGGRIVPSLDGVTGTAVSDSTFPTGTIGVRAVATQRSTRDNINVVAADGSTLYHQDFSSPAALDDFVDLANPPQDSVVAASARPAGSTGTSGLIDLTADATGSGTWQVPAGQWTVDTFSREYLNGDGGYLDLLDPEATRQMMNAIPGEYYRRFPWAFGTVLRGFWDDEPYIASASAHFATDPWAPGLPDALAAEGAALGPALTATFADLGRTGRTLRGAYWRAVSNMFADNYSKVQADWMAQHHVGYITNPLWDEYGPTEQVASTGSLTKDHQWAQVPGTDVIFNQYEPGGRTMLPRFPASAAHQNGQSRVLLESFGGHGWDTAPQYMQATLGAFAVRGINLNVLHALWTDPNNVVYPTQFEDQNPWWNQAKPLNDWIGRLDYVATGTPAAPTALIVPEQAAQQWQGSSEGPVIDAQFEAANDALEDRQADFDLLTDSALSGDADIRAAASVDHGSLTVGSQRYRLAVLPETPTISLAAVAMLTNFVRSGGTLAAVGALPSEETDGHDAELAHALGTLFAAGADAITQLGQGRAIRVATAAGLADVVDRSGAAAARLDPAAPSVRVLRVQHGAQTAFVINNESTARVSTAATFPVAGHPQLWDPRSGTVTDAPAYEVSSAGTTVPLSLQPTQTAIMVIDPTVSVQGAHLIVGGVGGGVGGPPVRDLAVHGSTMTGSLLVPGGRTQQLVGQDGGRYFGGSVAAPAGPDPVALDGNWSVQLRKPSATTVTQPLGSWTATDPGYSGAAEYQRAFTLPAGAAADRRWTLDLGTVGEAAQVTVNGTTFPPVLWKPYQLDITDALLPGTNTITVRVTNTLANAHGTATPSGLLGPVTLTPATWTPFTLNHVADAGAVTLTPPPTIATAPGQTRTFAVTVRRYGGGTGTVAPTVTPSNGLTASLTPSTVQVARNGTATVQLSAGASIDTPLGSTGTVTLTVGGTRYAVPVQVEPASQTGAASASSTYPGHPVSTVNDGVTDSNGWDSGQGWNDNTIDTYPDTVTINFTAPAPIGSVKLWTLDSSTYPATREGIVDADIQVQVDGTWQTVDQIRGNAQGLMTASFPRTTATAVRVQVLASRDHYSRIIELAALP